MKSSAQLREKKIRLGTWLSIGSPVVAELAANSGFDWLLFDLEHGCGSEAALLPQLQAIHGSGAAAIVRVGAPYPDLIARVLDWGADGLMIPHVSTAAEAETCVQAAHYPPRGRRGFSGTVRAYGYGLRLPADGEPLRKPLIMAQIETIEAVENVREIAQVDGVDVLFVGPSDLSFDLKARPKLAKRDYAACLKHVTAAAAKAGKSCGILTRAAAELPALRKQGFDWLAVDSDLAILRNGYRKLVEGFGA
ncbi:MAG: aldolase/citrate lyase family protein [Verrucomicrobia bacterium]|nr:aldolase/citrate lyase family protein [Verrucomicrobiota bacterium]